MKQINSDMSFHTQSANSLWTKHHNYNKLVPSMRETACELIIKKKATTKKKASAVCNDYVKQKRKGQICEYR